MASRRSLISLVTRSSTRTSTAQSWTPQTSLLDTLQPKTQLRSGSTTSTSALAYKALHRRSPLPLPVSDTVPSYGAAAAVSSILYETPVMSKAPPKKHILNCLVQNEPGVLSRISGILAARGFNIDSLVVCNTEVEDLSRMTIVLRGLDGVVEQARRQLEDLVPVWAVLDYTSAALVQRELLLAKVSILGPEVYEELMEHHREMTSQDGAQEMEENAEQRLQELESQQQQQQPPGDEKNGIIQRAKEALGQGADYHPSKLAASQALRHKHEHLEAITHLTHQFGGKVLDISTNNCIVEVYVLSLLAPWIFLLIQSFSIAPQNPLE
jgi:acetolactate synthase I/III small subunit